MKIGILTLPLRNNYGGIIQTYALQMVLRNMGHEVFLIRDKDVYKLPLWKVPFSFVKRVLFKYILRKKDAIGVFHEKTIPTRSFIDTYIQNKKITKVVRDHKNIDAIIVGSDQVWRPKYNNRKIENAYLSFAKEWDIKRIAYAASFGTDKWEYTDEQTENCKKLLQLFETVSVREIGGINLCKNYFKVNAQLVLDPTMLLDASHYLSLIERAQIKRSGGNFLMYVLDDDETIEKIKQKTSTVLRLTPFLVNLKQVVKIETWLRSFYDAEFVLTDSFHACVFSILFNKPFVVYGNVGRGLSRFNSLLRLFKLENRLVSSDTQDIEQVLNTPIDWSEVNEILCAQREMSNRFLMEALG